MLFILHLLVIIPAICHGSVPAPAPFFNFGNHEFKSLQDVLRKAHENAPEISRLYNLTIPSVEERALTVIEFASHPGQHIPKIPEFKYVGNMHGNEVVGREVLLALVALMSERKDERLNWLIDHTRIHILPSMNPDGYEKAYKEKRDENGQKNWLNGRANANDVDLNRNFPKLNQKMYYNEIHGGKNNHLEPFTEAMQTPGLQPETKAVMIWMNEIPFVLSSNLHGGDLVANYPYDATRDNSQHGYTASPDDATFRYLAECYSEKHTLMADKNRKPCDMSGDDLFEDGITNGADWYAVPGGMQDYNLLETNCFEITLELGCDKFPKAEEEADYWLQNKEALINYMMQVHDGVKGVITDAGNNNAPIRNAVIKVFNLTKPVAGGEDPDQVQYIRHDITSNKDGDYYRILIDGHYKLRVEKPGYYPQEVEVEVRNQPMTEALVQDFALVPMEEPVVDDRAYYDNLSDEDIARVRELLYRYFGRGFR